MFLDIPSGLAFLLSLFWFCAVEHFEELCNAMTHTAVHVCF